MSSRSTNSRHHLRNIGRASHAAARQHFIADAALGIAHDLHRQVVPEQGGAVVPRGADRDLEFTRQENEFGMQAGPLPDDLGQGAGILDLFGGGAGERIGGDIADAIAGWSGCNAFRLSASSAECRARPPA